MNDLTFFSDYKYLEHPVFLIDGSKILLNECAFLISNTLLILNLVIIESLREEKSYRTLARSECKCTSTRMTSVVM